MKLEGLNKKDVVNAKEVLRDYEENRLEIGKEEVVFY